MFSYMQSDRTEGVLFI
uniref:Uncharacterized protein n=1 Tax=Arundo donax TaxID=35708 RepID=A0A0A8YC90_ARUDO